MGTAALIKTLDEFPALGRLDFFESALAFMAGYLTLEQPEQRMTG